MATDVPTDERTIGQLVADASHDVQHIVRGEIALAKAEMSLKAKVMAKGAGLLGAAAFIGVFDLRARAFDADRQFIDERTRRRGAAAFIGVLGVLFLLHTIARVIAIWLPVWAGYGIVTLVLLLVAGVLALVGKKALENLDPAPRKAIADVQQTVASLKPGH